MQTSESTLTTKPAAVVITSLPLVHITASLTNPRKHFAEDALQDLAQSIKQHGILQPIVTRPVKYRLVEPTSGFGWRIRRCYGEDMAKTNGSGFDYKEFPKTQEGKARKEFEPLAPFTHEIIAGERRFRAAKVAGLAEIPAVVRDMDDKQVLEVQVIENLQRSDLHPLEEAEGYELLMTRHKFTADEIADRIGKKKGYVYGRLKLTALCPEARKAFYAGTLTPSTALLVARIPHPDLQKACLKDLTPYRDQDPISYREAFRMVHQRYMCTLTKAPFDTKDERLFGGPCAVCPKRTGNQKELFADVGSADVCTDPKCFGAKREAWTKLQEEALKAESVTILPPDDRKRVFQYSYNNEISRYTPFRELTSKCPEDPKGRTYAKLLADLGDKAPDIMGTVDDAGKPRKLVHSTEVANILKGDKTIKIKDGSPAGERMKRRAEIKASADEDELRVKECDAIMGALVAKIEGAKWNVPAEVWRAMLGTVLLGCYAHQDSLERRRKAKSYADLLAGKPSSGVLAGIFIELLCSEEYSISKLCQFLKIDTKAIVKKVQADHKAVKEIEAGAKAQKAAKSKPAKTKTAKAKK